MKVLAELEEVIFGERNWITRFVVISFLARLKMETTNYTKTLTLS